MIDFPPDTRPHDRAILIVFHVLGIKKPKEITSILGYKSPSEVYRCLQKYNGINLFGHDRMITRTVTISPIESE